ncbi:glycosyl hydrolase family 28-related protein [Pedobacter duraquae]|uniref:SMP-30/gluconolaconase/LRE-like protein n=1 Tax=Pedobacter duraquae TaxID=425511 RepID=A0A4R6IG78_9SPHI|nr:glycosyl hydrolase family 28-related protein [Pedobacter duraquae]TDO21363.1 SMP-30/gluconolaconase/LRE-like protein [Pedobacter duraquae]
MCLKTGFCLLGLCFGLTLARAADPGRSRSFYPQKLDDANALYFTSESFKITADGKSDVSDELQSAINQVKNKYNFGILFIPEGKYLISKTIFIPTAVRLIGYGTTRPEFTLGRNSPGFQLPDPQDKGKSKYMFWFTNAVVQPGQAVRDAGPSTFYSALSNVDLRIADGNPQAIALRTHYAQHSFIAHVDIHIGTGKAGIYDVGNEMEDVRFFNGDYGIYTTKASPGWQFMMVDTYFEGQRRAAIKTQEAGLTIVRMRVKNVPIAVDIDSNYHEKLFMEDCQLEQVSAAAIVISNEGNAFNQIALRNVDCLDVPLLIKYRLSKNQLPGSGKIYKIKELTIGLQIDGLHAAPVYKTTQQLENLAIFPKPYHSDIPQFPAIKSWVNLKSLGAKGDGDTDDTKIIQDAIDKYETIYLPQGWYRVSQTILLKKNTKLIGLSPIATQLILADLTPAFGSFGGPKALLETPKGGENIVTGIGLNTGVWNNRAVACKWMSGVGSFLNDVKFIGGHGSINPGPQQPRAPGGTGNQPQNRILQGKDVAWDSQYWSLWITNGGGGVFKNIWTASTFATSGIFVSNTATPSRIYAMSVEHHVRNEVRFKNVSNWKVYALQLEEESRESSDVLPLELESCENMVFANLYMFRVIRINTPAPYSIRSWSSKNIEFLNVHNYSQTKYTATAPVYDITSGTEVRPWEFVRLFVDSLTPAKGQICGMQLLAKGFEFADGICKDSKGNIYFGESRMRRIYKWSAKTQRLSLLADFPWEPFSLACDKNDNLLVVFKYQPRPGFLSDGKPEVFPTPADASGTSFGGYGNSGYGVWAYSIDPENPEESIQLLKKAPMGSVQNIYKALYPANRWRDFHDFNTVTVNKPQEMFVATDGVTIIPIVYDLARSNNLIEAYPGKLVYATDEYDKRTVKLAVDQQGYLSDLQYFVEKGEYSSAADATGNLYVADGQIYVFDPSGKQIRQINVPERPVTLAFGGSEGKTLFITTRTSLYSINP